MPATIDEATLGKIFDALQPEQVTTQAKYWIFADGIKTAPTVFVPGENTIVLDGKPKVFQDGAFVYKADGKIQALPAYAADGGGITVDGGPVQPVKNDPIYRFNKTGNIATLTFNEAKVPGTGSLSLSMPEDEGPGFSIPWPAHTPEQLVKIAQDEGAIVKVKDGSGRVLEGFFSKGNGGAVPDTLGPYASGTRFGNGDFVSITQHADGSSSLFAFKNYTPAQIAEQTYGGSAPLGNNINQLTTLDGEPLNTATFPRLNFQAEPEKTVPDAAPAGQPPKLVDGAPPPPTGPKLPTPKLDTPPPPGPKLPTPKLDTPPPVAEATSAIGKLTRFLAPAALLITPIVEGATESYQDYQKDHSVIDAAGGAVVGAGKGVIDTFLPGAREGYSDVVGSGNMTALDRTLNAASDFTGTATAIGSTALVAETAGVVSIPATIPTGIVTFAAGMSNLGINAVKGVLKATGYAGKDQDGGYLYDAGKFAIDGVEHLFGPDAPAPKAAANSALRSGRAQMDAENLLKQSASKSDAAEAKHGKPKHVDSQKG
jgi:hypothetical protein